MPADKCLLCFSDAAAVEFDGQNRLMEFECCNSACGDYIVSQAAASRIRACSCAEHLELSRAAKEAALQGLILELEVTNHAELTALAVTPRSRR
jgi:hypothetical protein